MLSKGIDISNWTGSVPVETFARFKADGYTFVIAGTHDVMLATLQCQSAGIAGLETELYVYLYYDGNDARRIERAIETATRLGIDRVWLDVEREPDYPPVTVSEVIPVLDDGVRAIEANGLDAGIYTNGRYWQELTGGNMKFSHLPLWNAAWLMNREPTEEDFTEWLEKWPEFGGWKQPTIWQYRGSTEMHGINVDLNMAYSDEVSEPEIPSDLPDDKVVAHALSFAYVAWYENDRSIMHGFDAALVERVNNWLNRGGER